MKKLTKREISKHIKLAKFINQMDVIDDTGRSNQIIIRIPNIGQCLFSYGTPIVLLPAENDLRTIIFPAWNYSRTTSKYRIDFLRESTLETEIKLLNCEYIFADDYFLKGH